MTGKNFDTITKLTLEFRERAKLIHMHARDLPLTAINDVTLKNQHKLVKGEIFILEDMMGRIKEENDKLLDN